MRLTLFALALASVATLSASDHELNLVVSKQLTRDFSAADLSVKQPVGVTFRYGYDVIGLGPAQVQCQVGYHAQTSADLSSSSISEKYTNKGLSLGLQAQWRLGVVLGAGAELRAERLQSTTLGSTTQIRPWLTGRVGFSLPLPLVQPVVGLEVAVPTTNKSADSGSSSEDILKRLSPSFEVSVYGGVRF